MAAPVITATPTFMAHWVCPYAQRAWAALNHKGVEYTYVHIDLLDKPAWFKQAYPLGKVPVIAFKDEAGQEQTVVESLVLLEFVDEQYKGAALYPPSPVARAHARIAINRIDQKLVAAYNKIVFQFKAASDKEAAQATGKELGAELDWLESELTAHGGPYLTGKNFTAVDAAVAPWILRAAILEHFRGYKMLDGRPQLTAYARTLHGTKAVAATLTGPADKAADVSWQAVMIDMCKGFGVVHLF